MFKIFMFIVIIMFGGVMLLTHFIFGGTLADVEVYFTTMLTDTANDIRNLVGR